MPVPCLDLTAFARCSFMDSPTPIQHLPRLSQRVGGPQIYVKRDDLSGLGGGGNKLRKLEFLMGEALASGADTVITVGARQSNHARLTAAVAAREGLSCELVLARTVPREDEAYSNNGNILLDELLGARIHDVPAGTDVMAFAANRADELRLAGRNVYLVPLGGSSAIGCLGYASAAAEILAQAHQAGLKFDPIILPNGSGGTQAGLVAGMLAMGQDPTCIMAHTVLAPTERALAITEAKVAETLAILRSHVTVGAQDIVIKNGQLGLGYGLPTDAMREAVRMLASTEGLLIDPVYGGKAFAGLLQDIRDRQFAPEAKILFLMTGGLPGLFAYRSAF